MTTTNSPPDAGRRPPVLARIVRRYATLRVSVSALPAAARAEPSPVFLRRALAMPDPRDATRLARVVTRRQCTAASLCLLGSRAAAHGLDRGARAGADTLAPLQGLPGFVLALPFSGAGLAIVLAAARTLPLPLLVLRTSVSAAYLEPLLASFGGRVRLAAAEEMVRHQKASRAAGGRAAGYVTFPEHFGAGPDRRWQVDMLGQPHCLSLLEPLLQAGGAGPIYALDGAAAVPTLVRGPGDGPSRELTGAHVDAVLRWLADSLERTIRNDPGDLLSWRALQRNTAEAVRRTAVGRVNDLRSYLRAWEVLGPGLPSGVIDWSLAHLKALEQQQTDRISFALN